MTELRQELRSFTRPAHAATERLYAAFDLSTSEGLAMFLQAHGCALEYVHRILVGLGDRRSSEIERLYVLILRDLSNLGVETVSLDRLDYQDRDLSPLGLT